MDERIEQERAFHDAHYREISRAGGFRDVEEEGLDLYLDHTVSFLDAIEGRDVLDCGTGDGTMSLWFARRGARVTSFDISAEALRLARERARTAGVEGQIRFVQCSFEDLPFHDRSVDVAFGSLILHHVDVAHASAELGRVLRPGGLGVFSENFAFNPVLNFARRHLVGRFGIPRLGTLTEEPLGEDQVARMREHLDVALEWPDFLFLQLLDRQVFRYRCRPVGSLCRGIDRWIYRNLHRFRKYSYRGTIVLGTR